MGDISNRYRWSSRTEKVPVGLWLLVRLSPAGPQKTLRDSRISSGCICRLPLVVHGVDARVQLLRLWWPGSGGFNFDCGSQRRRKQSGRSRWPPIMFDLSKRSHNLRHLFLTNRMDLTQVFGILHRRPTTSIPLPTQDHLKQRICRDHRPIIRRGNTTVIYGIPIPTSKRSKVPT